MGKKTNLAFFVCVLLAMLLVGSGGCSHARVVYRSPELQEVVNQNGGFVNVYDENDRLVKEEIPHFTGAKLSHSWLGQKFLLPVLKHSWTAGIFGFYKRSRLSKFGIADYCRKHNIDLKEFKPSNPDEFESYNHFFIRQLSDQGKAKRTPEENDFKVASPADSKIFVLETLDKRDHFWVKESDFCLKTFLNDKKLASEFDGGSMIIFRLAPHDYHRFHAPLDFKVIKNYKLSGDLESVNPFSYAKQRKPLGKNKRQIIVGEHEKIGQFVIAPVGAMIVGNIVINNQEKFEKGEEMGRFEFGGSTVVLLFKKDTIKPMERFVKNSATGIETKILTGQSFADLIVG